MRKLILSTVAVLFIGAGSLFLASCDNNSPNNKQAEQHEHADGDMHEKKQDAYACPMHPEITGKKGDKCSKCGMNLTAMAEGEHAGHGHD
ncbi:MAG: hypothetical protein L3J31_00405 [Bacteroidales bacterium]|nr:hypothetical protein [Bacteroidales bacterium]MCF6341251.1 hypothetical protein [Bacteroidales bacterium]